jgi:GNAT superfamily N-acetyltransferase
MKREHISYEIDDCAERIDLDQVHAWLASTYWSPGVAREKVEKAARNSAMLVGVYQRGVQVAYLRVISDRTTFAYLCDVFVDEAHRKQGIAKAMVRFALEHPDFQGLRRWLLATQDAHEVYRSVGFDSLPMPERWMCLQPSQSPSQNR